MLKPSSPDAFEKARLARMTTLAAYVWGDEGAALRWMHTAHVELGGQTPLEASRTEAGTLRVEDLLNRVFYGMPV